MVRSTATALVIAVIITALVLTLPTYATQCYMPLSPGTYILIVPNPWGLYLNETGWWNNEPLSMYQPNQPIIVSINQAVNVYPVPCSGLYYVRGLGMYVDNETPLGTGLSGYSGSLVKTSEVVAYMDLVNYETSTPFSLQFNAWALDTDGHTYWLQLTYSFIKEPGFVINIFNFSGYYYYSIYVSGGGHVVNNVATPYYAYGNSLPLPNPVWLVIKAQGNHVLFGFSGGGSINWIDNVTFPSNLTLIIGTYTSPSNFVPGDLEVGLVGYSIPAGMPIASFSSLNATLGIAYWNGASYVTPPILLNVMLTTGEYNTNVTARFNGTLVNLGVGSPAIHVVSGGSKPQFSIPWLAVKGQTTVNGSNTSIMVFLPKILWRLILLR